MNILTVEGNVVTLAYNPGRESVEVGDNIAILDRWDNRGVLVQVIEISVPELPGILLEIVRREAASKAPVTHEPQQLTDYKQAVESTKLARARIMMEVRRVDSKLVYERWSGYVPSRNADFRRVSPSEVVRALRERRLRVGER
uniref:Uncharacterized protein n=1 Tax=Thermofilum pendens TaxID=2269 RepID=A0A7C4BAR1_THEPE